MDLDVGMDRFSWRTEFLVKTWGIQTVLIVQFNFFAAQNSAAFIVATHVTGRNAFNQVERRIINLSK